MKKALILLACIAILASCESSKKADTKVSKEKAILATVNREKTKPTSEKQDSAAIIQTVDPGEDKALSKAAPLGSAKATTNSGGLASGTLTDNKLTTVLETIARNLEAKKLAYVSSLGQDCSGIFHQLKDSVQMRIPTLADQAKYSYPSFTGERNSRQIADWYYRNNNLLIVQDPLAERNEIRPGSVMFFGRTDEQYSNIDIELLTNPGKFVHDGQLGKIMHIAVVTSVEKDEAGNVSKYTIMHGRNSKYPASRSSGNYDGPGGFAKAFAKFPFGNWNQQWVAMAHIETPK